MVLFATHFLAFLFLFPVGIRRLIFSLSLYLQNPSQFTSKAWYFSGPKWKNGDMYALLLALPIASFSHIYLFFAISGHPNYRFSFLAQSLLIFIFWALLVLISLKESLDLYVIPESFVFILCGIAFVIEYYMNGQGILGLGGVAYELLGGLALVCAACCLYLSISPSAFFADFLLSSGLVLKAVWVLQVGMSLYTDAFSLKGCEKMAVSRGNREIDVKCELEEDKLRGVALTNLLFVVHTALVLFMSFSLLGLLHRHRSNRSREVTGPLLSQIGSSEGIVMNPLPIFEIE
ncbi:uncharacterized protein [Coffea arabica]|uniref:Transmembrane protein 45B-like n=1 Tax=Coffea arabica TaxID=13443 RepID=A0A6P6WZB9_COFAR|nr:uncharacterized protein LOC113737936 [Coffea arabica]